MSFLVVCIWSFIVALSATRDSENNNLSFWDTFQWELSLERSKVDEFLLQGFLEDKQTKEKVKMIPGATCNETEVEHRNRNNLRFQIRCRCDLHTSSFVPGIKRCIANIDLKQGCKYTTGSWQGLKKWTWDTTEDSPMIVDYKRAYGITTGFNASTKEYDRCSVQTINYWKQNMEWVRMRKVMSLSRSVFFKLQGVWHLSWNTDGFNDVVMKSIEGKILKFVIECEKLGNRDELRGTRSCLVFKVSSELTYTSVFKNTFTSLPTLVSSRGTSGEGNTAIILAATFITAAALITISVIVICYVRKRACFASRSSPTNAAVLDHRVTLTELLDKKGEESVA